MNPTDIDRLRDANDAAQLAFRAMLACGDLVNANDPCVKTYTAAERLIDAILIDLQGQRAQAELDALIDGDHFAYPAGFAAIDPRDGGRLDR